MTPNVSAAPSPGSTQQTQSFGQGMIVPPVLPPISDTNSNIRAAMLDQLAGFQISLFQHLFLIPENPDLEKTAFSFPGGGSQLRAIQQDIDNIKATVIAINQITNTPANRIPANASINTNYNYTFLDNSVIDACNQLARDILIQGNTLAAQPDYATLRDLLNPYYGF